MSDLIQITLRKGDSDEMKTIEVQSLHFEDDSDDATVFMADGSPAKINNATDRIDGVMPA
jgi:hypothetical protein